MLGEDNWQPDKPLVVIQNGAPDRVAQRLGVNIFPYVLRLDQQETNFNADWPVINVQPAKHTGYAVQWFALATALVVLTLFASSNLSDRFRAKASVNEKTGIKK